jgi:hypothetical protein
MKSKLKQANPLMKIKFWVKFKIFFQFDHACKTKIVY